MLKNLAFVLALAVGASGACPRLAVADTLITHPVSLDAQGRLLPWAPFGQVLNLGWEAFERIPVQDNGLRTYFTYSRFNADPAHLFEGIWWAHNPAGLTAMLVSGATAYYAYSGDHRILDQVRESVDYDLAHGMTPSDWSWSSVPFASSFPGALEYRGADDTYFCQDHAPCGRGDGEGFIEPDKVAELGLAFLRTYDLTGDPRYLGAALDGARALALHARTGDEWHSPWPFRVDGRTGRIVREEYSANVIAAIALYDALAQEGVQDASFAQARAVAWDWLMRVPMVNMNWQGYFEDIPIHQDPSENPNQYIALETARYLLWHPEMDPQWQLHARRLIDWTAAHFAVDFESRGEVEPGIQYGAEVLSEQRDDMAKMGSHTARFASVLALYAERTGDVSTRERAFRSLAWASYTCSSEGIVKVGTNDGEGYWFSDGYGDYLRHFQSTMASQPDWAPKGEDHLLRTTSVVRAIRYAADQIVYDTAHPQGAEWLVLRAAPLSVSCGGALLADGVDAVGDSFTRLSGLPGGGFALLVQRSSCAHVVVRLGQ